LDADYPNTGVNLACRFTRQDTTVFASANIGFTDIEYAGFTPGLRLDVSNTDSNVSRFDRTAFSAGLTIRSQF